MAYSTWHRQQAFEAWYATGRDFAVACDKLQQDSAFSAIRRQTLWRWAKEDNWEEKADKRDEEAYAIVERMAIEDVAAMLLRHAMLGRQMQKLGEKRLGLFEKHPGQITASEMRQLIKDGVEIERVSRGLPARGIGIEVEHTLDDASQQFLSRLDSLIAVTATGGVEGSGDDGEDSE